MSLDFKQVVDGLGQGVAVVDRDGAVLYWNHWLERASGRRAEAVAGRPLTELYPSLLNPAFERNLRAVFSLGIVCYYSQLVHGTLFPFKPLPGSPPEFDAMQQRCSMGPVRDRSGSGEIVAAYILVEDVSEAAAAQRRLAELAVRDGLTKAFNRRYLDRRLADEIARAERFGRPLSLALVDIDHFKQVNDARGHQCGDRALAAVSAALRSGLRESDVLARYGGEEFCILLLETEPAAALATVERLRAAVAATPIQATGPDEEPAEGSFRADPFTLTVSAGVAGLMPGEGPAALLERADAALYRAKRRGRNRVVAAGPEAPYPRAAAAACPCPSSATPNPRKPPASRP